LFRDTVVLDYDFQPKVLKYRENEQLRFATAIRPLLEGHNGRNVFVYGPPGIGKTTACKHVLKELEEEATEIVPFYVNCWKENTTFKVFIKICDDLGYKFIQSKKTSELFTLIQQKLNKKTAVFVFDEVDKLEDLDFLYTILEDIYRKSIFLITNYRDTYSELDERIRSRLVPEFLCFRQYLEREVLGILLERRNYAFSQNSWDEEAFKEIVEKCTEANDLRVGLYLMKEAGNIAEEKNSRKVLLEHAALAIKKAEEFQINPAEDLNQEMQKILDLIKNNSNSKIGDLFTKYEENGGQMSYKSFHRRIAKLSEGRFISTEKVSSKDGNTTIVSYASEKKLTEF